MNGFPKVCCYFDNVGYGRPLVPTNSHSGALDLDLCAKLARHSEITLSIAPWYAVAEPWRTDALMVLRRLNPRIRIHAYMHLGVARHGPSLPENLSDKTFWRTWHNAIRDTSGFGVPTGELKPDGSPLHWWLRWDQPATEAALTKLLCGVASSRLFDGFFFDYFWATSASSADAMQRAVHAIRQAGGPGFLVLGNGPHADTLDADGAFREGFPESLGNDFAAIKRWREARPHRTEDWLQAGTGYMSLDTPDAKRAARFAHGTACLFGAKCSFGPNRDPITPSYATWWMDEYSGAGLGTGWLGEPLWPARPREGFAAGGYERAFAGGHVIVNVTNSQGTYTVPKGLFDIRTGNEMGTVTVAARDAVFLVRAR